MRSAMLRFGASTLGVLVLVLVAAVGVSEHLASQEASSLAERDARALGERYVLPLGLDVLDPGGDRARLDAAFAADLAQGSLLRVKIWADAGELQGTIVYSDNRLLQGAVVELPETHALFTTRGAVVERIDGPVPSYAVHLGFADARGTAFIFEASLPEPPLVIGRGEVLRVWLPVVIGSVLLFALATLPMALGLARRVREVEAERRRIGQLALHDSLAERRRLAQQLHDGVIQELAGAGLALDAVNREGLGQADDLLLTRATRLVRRQVGELRTLGDNLFPDAVSAGSLGEAVTELVRGLGGLTASVDMADTVRLDEDLAFLVYRVVREGVRNVVAHADATTVRITVGWDGGDVVVGVTDDGRGLGTPRRAGSRRDGGLGLRLLTHEVREKGGTLDLRSLDQGAELIVRLPVW